MTAAAQPEEGNGGPFSLEIAPEAWYASWTPHFTESGCGDVTCNSANESGFKLNPALLTGVRVSGEFGGSSFFVDYLESKQAPASMEIDQINRWRDFVAMGLFRVTADWYLETELLTGNFSGTAEGSEWNRTVGSFSQIVNVNTAWTEGEVDAVFQLGDAAGFYHDIARALDQDGTEVGYRLESYRLPALVVITDRQGNASRIDFENTAFLSHYLVLGLRQFPGSAPPGFSLSSDTKLLIGFSEAQNADLNKVLLSLGLEGEVGLQYKKNYHRLSIDAFLGLRGKVIFMEDLDDDSGSYDSSGNSEAPGPGQPSYFEHMTDITLGPLARFAFGF